MWCGVVDIGGLCPCVVVLFIVSSKKNKKKKKEEERNGAKIAEQIV